MLTYGGWISDGLCFYEGCEASCVRLRRLWAANRTYGVALNTPERMRTITPLLGGVRTYAVVVEHP